jgi:hypothetical protein
MGGQRETTKEMNNNNYRPFSYDIDAVIGFSKEQLDSFLRVFETENIELIDENRELMRKIRALEADVRHYKELVKTLEEIKISEKASKSIWKTIAAAFAITSSGVSILIPICFPKLIMRDLYVRTVPSAIFGRFALMISSIVISILCLYISFALNTQVNFIEF